MKPPVYLDYNATTPVAPEVADAIEPFLRTEFGNPSSSHALRPAGARGGRPGARTRRGADRRRCRRRSSSPAARPRRTTSPSSASRARCAARRRHIVTSAIEHPAVMQPCLRLEEDGWDVTVVPVDGDARVDLEALARALRDDTALVTIMHANNEVGTLQDIADDRGARPRARRARAHRRRAVGRQDPRRRRCARRRPADDRRTQVLRDQGRRRAVRPPRNASRAGDRRRGARARAAARNRERAGDRRARRGGAAGA